METGKADHGLGIVTFLTVLSLWHGLRLSYQQNPSSTMATQNTKRIGKRPEKEAVTITDTLHDTWRVMKPFVHFSMGALKVVAKTMIFIVKHIPKPEGHHPKPKNNKVIKI
jgi:hypothetical protein